MLIMHGRTCADAGSQRLQQLAQPGVYFILCRQGGLQKAVQI